MKPVVQFEDVNFTYQHSAVLSHVSLEVFEEEFIGIIGPNGGGKTTLLKLILGFLKPTTGKVFVFGKAPGHGNHETGNHPVAYVPQSIRFDRQFPISVLEVVLSGCLSHLPWYGKFSKKDKDLALNALEMVGLTHLQDASFGKLSGGQSQRILIARALASDPKLLLLDEPTASVDSQAEADIYAILKDLRKKMTIMMVTHDLKAAIEQVEKVICVQREAISLKPEEVCEHFALGLYHPPLIQPQLQR